MPKKVALIVGGLFVAFVSFQYFYGGVPAIADYNQTSALKSAFAHAYDTRDATFMARGRPDQANSDFDPASRRRTHIGEMLSCVKATLTWRWPISTTLEAIAQALLLGFAALSRQSFFLGY